MSVGSTSRIPAWVKWTFSAYMAVLIPVYWYNYGPSNFLYFCDLALLLTLVGIWREDALLVSMPAVGILLPQVLWIADFLGNLAGFHLTGMTDYMFDSSKSLFLRGLSLFHGWLPFLLVFLVARFGYDRRALPAWTILAWLILAICYLFMPGPTPNAGNAAVNINYVFGMSDQVAQTWMPPLVWFGCLLTGLPLLMFAPTHIALSVWHGFGLPAPLRPLAARLAAFLSHRHQQLGLRS